MESKNRNTSKTTMIRLSIIIITWNGKEKLRQCLKSIASLKKRPDVEFILIDNGSTDGTQAMIESEFPYVKYRHLNTNRGVSYARNRGLERARGRFMMILDNDTIASSQAIEGMEYFMEKHPEYGLCGCRLTDPDGTPQDNCKKYPGITEKVKNILHRHSSRYSYPNLMNNVFEPEYLIGACQFFRREAYLEAGPLDENIFYGPEDADFCLRIRKKGWKICYLPQFSIIHLCQRSTNRNLLSGLALKHIFALFYFYAKHRRIF